MPDERDIRAELIRAAHGACDAFHFNGTPGLDVEDIFYATPMPAMEEHGLHGLCVLREAVHGG